MAATLGLQFGKRRMSSQTNPVQLVHRRGRPDTLNEQGRNANQATTQTIKVTPQTEGNPSHSLPT